MDTIYMTSNIFYHKEHLYSKKNKYKKIIKDSNWDKYLGSYGWVSIDQQWKYKLSQQSEINLYGLLECGGHGDCLFHCLAEGLNNILVPEESKYDSQQLRVLAAEQINKDNFDLILGSYKLEAPNLDWDPEMIFSVENLQDEIKQEGHNFWGDHIIIQLLEQALEVNIVILDSLSTSIYNTCSLFKKEYKTVFLYYQDNIHFQLVGYFDKIMKTNFKYSEIPNELAYLINQSNN